MFSSSDNMFYNTSISSIYDMIWGGQKKTLWILKIPENLTYLSAHWHLIYFFLLFLDLTAVNTIKKAILALSYVLFSGIFKLHNVLVWHPHNVIMFTFYFQNLSHCLFKLNTTTNTFLWLLSLKVLYTEIRSLDLIIILIFLLF